MREPGLSMQHSRLAGDRIKPLLTRGLLHTIVPMLKVLTAEQMREVDRLTTERYGVPSIILMENAAHAVARVITEKLGGSVKGKSILILCGPGNNGGDGAALARLLSANEGAGVMVLLLAKIEDTRGDARTNFEALRKLESLPAGQSPDLFVTQSKGSERDFGGVEIAGFDVIVDAVVGTGASRSIDEWLDQDFVQPLREWKRDWPRQRPLRVAIDVPSGISTDDGKPFDRHFDADVTVTFTAPKPANILPPATDINGEMIVAHIGSPHELVDEQPSQLFLADRGDAKDWLRKSRFTNSSYKNKRGHALMIAGSKNYSGAAVLCGDAAIRSGCGLVTIATPESSRESIVARVSPEVMVRGISETEDGSAAEGAVDEVKGFLKNVDVIAIGSGLSSKENETKAFVRRIVEERITPVVIDADGLTALSPWTLDGLTDNGIAGETPAVRPLVLTPHEGEFLRLLGTGEKDAIKDRVTAVREFAIKHGVILVLKGERALIGHPDGRVVVNPTGNSGLGKAGNGDTLTGIIAGFIAQAVQMKIDVFETVVAAVYVAGMAGDIAEKKYGKRVMTASDVRECLAEVFAELGAE